MAKKTYYWDKVSEEIGKLFLRYFKKNMTICEVGFAGGHFLEFLESKGYNNLIGIEIREEQFKSTEKRFNNINMKAKLINADIFDVESRYDAIYSTGLIQCFDENNRQRLFKHLAKISPIAIFTVPVIDIDRNVKSKEEVAVTGCKEFCTGSLGYELSNYFNVVREGFIGKKITKIEDDYLFFVCMNENTSDN